MKIEAIRKPAPIEKVIIELSEHEAQAIINVFHNIIYLSHPYKQGDMCLVGATVYEYGVLKDLLDSLYHKVK